VYAKLPNATVPTTRVRLVGFDRVFVKAGQSAEVTIDIRADAYAVVHDNPADVYKDTRFVEKGELELYVGGGQPDYVSTLSTTVIVTSAKPLASC
jgi:hypothetical protein